MVLPHHPMIDQPVFSGMSEDFDHRSIDRYHYIILYVKLSHMYIYICISIVIQLPFFGVSPVLIQTQITILRTTTPVVWL